MSTNDGGPAFPGFQFTEGYGPMRRGSSGDGWETFAPGMTLRDWFAGKAMSAMVAGEGARQVAARDGRYDETNWAQIVASNAYAFADAMLVERARPVPPLIDPPTA